jgi:hypothetical protein
MVNFQRAAVGMRLPTHSISGILKDLEVPFVTVADVNATRIVLLDPPDEALQPADQGVADADSAASVGEFGNGGADARDILQPHVAELIDGGKAFSNNRIALAVIPSNLGKAGTKFDLGRIHCSRVDNFKLHITQG